MELRKEMNRIIDRIEEYTTSSMRDLVSLLTQINSATRSAQYMPREALLLLKFLKPNIESARESLETSLRDTNTLKSILSKVGE